MRTGQIVDEKGYTKTHPADTHRKKRLHRAIRIWVAALFAGIVYAVFVTLTGLAYPCPLRLISGLRCPLCGITTCLLALMRSEVRAAFLANPFVFCGLLPGLLYLLYRTKRYVTDGDTALTRTETALLTAVTIAAVVFCIVRNLSEQTYPQMFHGV